MKNLKKSKKKMIKTWHPVSKSINECKNAEQIAQQKLIEISQQSIQNYQNILNLDSQYFRMKPQQNSITNKNLILSSPILMNFKKQMKATLKTNPQRQTQKIKQKECVHNNKKTEASLPQEPNLKKFRSKTVCVGKMTKSPIINYTNFVLFDEREPVIPAQYIQKQQRSSNSIISKYKRYFNRLSQNKTKIKIDNQFNLSNSNTQFKQKPHFSHYACNFFKQKSKILKIIVQKPTQIPLQKEGFIMKSNSTPKKSFFNHHYSQLKKYSQSFM